MIVDTSDQLVDFETWMDHRGHADDHVGRACRQMPATAPPSGHPLESTYAMVRREYDDYVTAWWRRHPVPPPPAPPAPPPDPAPASWAEAAVLAGQVLGQMSDVLDELVGHAVADRDSAAMFRRRLRVSNSEIGRLSRTTTPGEVRPW